MEREKKAVAVNLKPQTRVSKDWTQGQVGMDDIFYRDCPRDGAEIPVREHQRKRWEEGLCVFCGAAEKHKDRCPEAWRDVFQVDQQNVGADGFPVTAKPDSYSIREALSQRQRNWHKKKRAVWFRRNDEGSELAQLIALTLRHGNLLKSPKKARHAMRSWLRMRLKWGTNLAMKGKRAAGLAAIRVGLERLRRKGREFVATLYLLGKKPIDVVMKLGMRYIIMIMRDMSLTADDPDSK